MSDVASKFFATARVHELADEMKASGLWKQKGDAAMFLAAMAAVDRAKSPEITEKKKDLTNLYSLIGSANDLGELVAFHILDPAGTVDETLKQYLPRYAEHGANIVASTMSGGDVIERLENIISVLEKAL